MIQVLSIIWNSFKMALQELRVNKLRTFLSLFGITIGIFCIIGVLATINSLQSKIQADLKAFGNNTIYIDKWQYGNGPDFPWWKYIKRPEPKYEELRFIREKSIFAKNMCYFASANANVSQADNILNNANIYCVTEDFNQIQTIEIASGRYFGEADYERGTPVAVMGYENASLLFGNAQKAVGKIVSFSGKQVMIIGLIKKQGSSIIDGFDYDHCVLTPYRFFASVYNVKNCNPVIMVQAKEGIKSALLADELRGAMRQIHKLSPTADDDFACNDVSLLGDQVSSFFGSVNLGGWAIAGLSLIVGAFGVANIMFVTVRERTSQIGLKKAIGAKRSTILTEFLLESAFLCIVGGLIGLSLVWLLALGLSSVIGFPIIIAPSIIVLALTLCIVLGIIAGIVPAIIAARMDPVVAIRTK